ncbi:MAG TPA: DUF1330 domain-containing protein [Candidatus Methylacidiphilales bacterium]
MQEPPVLVIIEVVSVQDPVGLKVYQERVSALIAALGAVILGHGGAPVDGELGFAPLVIERWPSETAFRALLASEAYQPLRQIRLASFTIKVAIVPLSL